ncbi:site-2 protease family protein [Alteriqipengyuania lutimaris]|uniref:Site-2 protease family protein n=1 Tax=Alteriqipengyuania lutimaris TaxID=1538146 RepID=A0A395LGG6_9SPHN|nr:site-2 protease family protein [Alteriqipengyuania lutimaris]MBB3035103.1 Zn-dependent protease [Alteriqipengyuania lutimaris]RDS75721.1 site-2 protease family protein [Alteriqipengyuania lutimaris]
MTDTLTFAALLIPALIIAIVCHEVAHGWVALALGDSTAFDRGRLTLNPIRHVDPVGTLLVPGFLALVGGPIFGWAKPVPVVRRRLNNPRYGMMAVAAAGPLSNLVLALIGAVALGLALPPEAGLIASETGLPQVAGANGEIAKLPTALFFFIMINVFLAFFNLLPIPPFDGSHIVEGLLPRSLAVHWNRLQQVGMILFVVLIAVVWMFPDSGILANTIGPPVEWMMGRFLSITDWVAG